MVAQIPLALQGMDAFSALGLGLLVAACYDALRFVVGRSRLPVFLCDLLGSALAAVAAVSFAVSYSYTGFLRWYMVVGMAVGGVAYFYAVAPFTLAVRRMIFWIIKLPFLLIYSLLLRPVVQKLGARYQRVKKSRREKKKRAKTPLQEHRKVLYNSN